MNDVSDDPAYRATLERMRAALAEWQQRMGPAESETEAELLARIRPDGSQPVTPAPRVSLHEGQLLVQGESPHYSLSWRVDGGPWKLYTGGLVVDESAGVKASQYEVIAERYGWKESSIVSLD